MVRTADIEKESLEAHVELCQQRYESLEGRLSSIEKKVGDIYNEMLESRVSMNKVIIGSAGTIVAGLISTIIVLLLKIH
jgi:hypothetical protein